MPENSIQKQASYPQQKVVEDVSGNIGVQVGCPLAIFTALPAIMQ